MQFFAANNRVASCILESLASNGLRQTKKSLHIIIGLLTERFTSVRVVTDDVDECEMDEQTATSEDLLKFQASSYCALQILAFDMKSALDIKDSACEAHNSCGK